VVSDSTPAESINALIGLLSALSRWLPAIGLTRSGLDPPAMHACSQGEVENICQVQFLSKKLISNIATNPIIKFGHNCLNNYCIYANLRTSLGYKSNRKFSKFFVKRPFESG